MIKIPKMPWEADYVLRDAIYEKLLGKAYITLQYNSTTQDHSPLVMQQLS